MKFQNPSIHHSKVNTHTDRQAESNMPFQLFQSWGHKNKDTFFKVGGIKIKILVKTKVKDPHTHPGCFAIIVKVTVTSFLNVKL